MTDQEPVVRRQHHETTDPDEAFEMLRVQYGGMEPRHSGDQPFEQSLDLHAVDTAAGELSVGRMRNSMNITGFAAPVPQLTVALPTSGRLRYTCERSDAFGVRLASTWADFEAEWDDLTCVTASLDLGGVRRVGAETSGLDPAAVAFTDVNPVSPALGRYVASLVGTVKRRLLDDDAVMASPLVREHAFRQLASAVLVAFPNTTQQHDHSLGPQRGGPASLRRAIEFIDAHSHQPIGLAEIAAATGTGTRGLQAAFRRHRNTTPLGYLRGVRLECARAELAAGDPTHGDTVAAVAARWGFANPGRFSVEYRRRFGESPSTTLRR